MANESHSLHRETAAARALLDALRDDLDGDEQATADAIAGETSLFEAVDKALTRLTDLGGHLAAINATIGVLKERADRFERHCDRLRAALLAALSETNLKTLERPLATISVRPAPPKVVVTSEVDLPSQFWRLPDPVLDKKALSDALKAGEQIPGAILSNGNQAPILRISKK